MSWMRLVVLTWPLGLGFRRIRIACLSQRFGSIVQAFDTYDVKNNGIVSLDNLRHVMLLLVRLQFLRLLRQPMLIFRNCVRRAAT